MFTTTARETEHAAEVQLAMQLIVLRDLADLNRDSVTYRKAFVALYSIGRKAVYEAEALLKAEAVAERKAEKQGAA